MRAPESLLAAGAGRLEPGVLPALLRDAASAASGVLTSAVGQGGAQRTLRLSAGRLLGASSTVTAERLGETMVRAGLLSITELVRATTVVSRERRRLGDVLREQGALDPVRLREGLVLQTRSVVQGLFGCGGAAWRFVPEKLNGEALEATPGTVFLAAARRIEDVAVLDRALGDLERALRPADGLAVPLEADERALLARADGRRSLRRLLDEARLPALQARRAALALLCAGRLR
jgi:hypothetical protein